jgi:cell division protein FtsL
MLIAPGHSRKPANRQYSKKNINGSAVERQKYDSQLSTQRPAVPDDVRILLASVAGASLIIASLVFLVWTKMTQVQTGYKIHSLQVELMELRYERNALLVELSSLNRPGRLEKFAKQDFGMAFPLPSQVIESKSIASENQEANP